ncbi:MAG: hypothetical protein ACJZ65_00230 [Limisphaerales bacterium]
MLDAERCVLCTRCIRFSKDIAEDDALGIVNRGSYNTIATFLDTPFDNNYTLNTADICPVGAFDLQGFSGSRCAYGSSRKPTASAPDVAPAATP